MPATFPAHPAAVLPLKIRWPRRFDGVALVIGSMAPDLAYPLDGTWWERPHPALPPTYQIAHSWWGLLAWCLPVTLVCAYVVRRAAPAIAAHLPARPRTLALQDYGAIGRSRPAWFITVWSALLGAATHLVWDRLADGPYDLPSSVLGGLATLAMLVVIGRRRLIALWHGAAPPVPVRRGVFWTIIVAVVGAGALVSPHLPGASLPHTAVVRLLIVVACGFILAGTLAPL
jgi:uncharacterized protein DUF4184